MAVWGIWGREEKGKRIRSHPRRPSSRPVSFFEHHGSHGISYYSFPSSTNLPSLYFLSSISNIHHLPLSTLFSISLLSFYSPSSLPLSFSFLLSPFDISFLPIFSLSFSSFLSPYHLFSLLFIFCLSFSSLLSLFISSLSFSSLLSLSHLFSLLIFSLSFSSSLSTFHLSPLLPTRSGRSRASLLTDIYCAQKCVWVVINLRIHTELLIYIFPVLSPSPLLMCDAYIGSCPLSCFVLQERRRMRWTRWMSRAINLRKMRDVG